MKLEIIREINQMLVVFQVFQIYECWSAEEMKNFGQFGVVDGGAGDWHSEMLQDGLLFPEVQGQFV